MEQGSPKKKKIEEWKRQGRVYVYCDFPRVMGSVWIKEYFLPMERREWELVRCVHLMWGELPFEIYKLIADKLTIIKFRCSSCELFNKPLSKFNEYNGTCCEKCWQKGAMGPDYIKWQEYKIGDVCSVRWYLVGFPIWKLEEKYDLIKVSL